MQNDISDVIERSGLPMTEISKQYGIPYRTLQNWKSGVRMPPPYVSTLLKKAMENSNQNSD